MAVDLMGFLGVVLLAYHWFALVAAATRLRALLARPRIRHRWELTTGCLFIAIGLAIATTS
ncbi:hypothetical protein [Streptomyces alfalfae]|uniref:hypothetical protein n=1 Tax=Streptomyces alfalfae TaxID=1642299 RepID=UPI00281225A9|nr:hypothetical protein [Streptomyces alfalfae]